VPVEQLEKIRTSGGPVHVCAPVEVETGATDAIDERRRGAS